LESAGETGLGRDRLTACRPQFSIVSIYSFYFVVVCGRQNW